MPPARRSIEPAGIILANHARDGCKPSLVNPDQDPTAERLRGHALKPESHFPPLCLHPRHPSTSTQQKIPHPVGSEGSEQVLAASGDFPGLI